MATELDNPIDSPEAYDKLKLDGEPLPGNCLVQGGDERGAKVEHIQSIDMSGAYTVVRGEELAKPVYTIEVWRKGDIANLDEWLVVLVAGMNKRPPRVWAFDDPRTTHLGITQVIVEKISGKKKLAATKWGVTINFAQYKRQKPYGGVPKKPKSEFEKLVETQSAENKALNAQVEAAKKNPGPLGVFGV